MPAVRVTGSTIRMMPALMTRTTPVLMIRTAVTDKTSATESSDCANQSATEWTATAMVSVKRLLGISWS